MYSNSNIKSKNKMRLKTLFKFNADQNSETWTVRFHGLQSWLQVVTSRRCLFYNTEQFYVLVKEDSKHEQQNKLKHQIWYGIWDEYDHHMQYKK